MTQADDRAETSAGSASPDPDLAPDPAAAAPDLAAAAPDLAVAAPDLADVFASQRPAKPAPNSALSPESSGRIETFAQLAAEIRRRPALFGAVRLVAVDGPSGAGKTTFAGLLAAALGGAPVVHTDDLIDGWEDQLTFWDRLEGLVLGPLRRGETATYRRYVWQRQRFGGAPVSVVPASVVLLEGVTAARAVIRPELSMAVFVTAPAGQCLRRALGRDGEQLRPYLEKWREVEARHFTADRTAASVDLVVDGAPHIPHDPGTQYVRVCRSDDP